MRKSDVYIRVVWQFFDSGWRRFSKEGGSIDT